MHRATLVVALVAAQVVVAQSPVETLPAPRQDVVLRWNDAVLDAIRAEKTTPPVAARNLAVVHVAVFDAVNAVARTHQPFRFAYLAPEATADAAAAVAAHRILTALYPRRAAHFDMVLSASLDAVADGDAKAAGAALGRTVADRVLEWRRADTSLSRSAYTPRSAPGRWQPTPPDFRPPLLPEWTAVRPFALRHPATFRPDGPPALTSDAFAGSYREVKELGAVNSATRTAEQTEIARFWADGEGTVTPPGHWNRIARTVAETRRTSTAENARLFAMLNVAMADAAIACWDCKYQFDFWRPVTAIRAAAKLNNPALVANPDWTPLLPTPPFPAYTSGHSSFSGAASAVLAGVFGDDVVFMTTSDDLPGVTRAFAGFRAAADEAGMSRIYGGIHWSFDNNDGLAGGRKVGEFISQNFFQPKSTGGVRVTPLGR